MHAFSRLTASFRLIFIGAALLISGTAHAQRVITVNHPEIPKPTLIDLGTPGNSVGDQRLWHFKATASDGTAVRTDWIMTTIAIDAPEKGFESRITVGVFSFGDSTEHQIVLQGVALYPGEGAALERSSKTLRAVVGGTGKYSNAQGWVESSHRADGSWAHVFHLK
jgi:hypothetical protein